MHHGPALHQQIAERLAAFEHLSLPANGRKRAAVVVGVTQEGHGAGVEGLPHHSLWSSAPALLLTRRASGLRSHAGQWALPGGRMDEGETPEQAALRELQEEVGLTPDPDAVLGRLDDYATRSGYLITPVVLWLGAAAELRPNPQEVESVHRIPTNELTRDDAPIINRVSATQREVLRMPVGQRWIAAPTAAFLLQFREVCLLGRPTRVAHFDQPAFAWR
ncbi:MAG: NUDIX hydrolase [Betaproteobacteria bacterium]